MKIAVCDDAREYRLTLKEYCENFFSQKHIACEIFEFPSGEEILNSAENFDIAFLDVELGDTNGIEVARKLQKKNPNIVILVVTSHLKYIDDAMDIHAIRFINKPVSEQRIFSVLEKAVNEINKKVITIHLKGNQVLRIFASDVVYIESKFKKVIVNTREKTYESTDSLKTLSGMFSADFFAVPHSSYIVNLNYVKDFKRDEIFLLEPYDNVRISVATRKQTEFRRQFLNFIGDGIND